MNIKIEKAKAPEVEIPEATGAEIMVAPVTLTKKVLSVVEGDSQLIDADKLDSRVEFAGASVNTRRTNFNGIIDSLIVEYFISQQPGSGNLEKRSFESSFWTTLRTGDTFTQTDIDHQNIRLDSLNN